MLHFAAAAALAADAKYFDDGSLKARSQHSAHELN